MWLPWFDYWQLAIAILPFQTDSTSIVLLRYARRSPEAADWATRLLARLPFKVVTVALANKMARIAWALLARGAVSVGKRQKG